MKFKPKLEEGIEIDCSRIYEELTEKGYDVTYPEVVKMVSYELNRIVWMYLSDLIYDEAPNSKDETECMKKILKDCSLKEKE